MPTDTEEIRDDDVNNTQPELAEVVDSDDIEEVSGDVAMLFADDPLSAVFTAEDEDGRLFKLEAGEFPRRHMRRILFSGMSLAVEERNSNGDNITADNLGELAATIKDMPISDRHPRRGPTPVIFGVFTGGNVATVQVDGKPPRKHLLASGYMWAGRHPVLVRETITGQRRASIEAHSREVGCGVCGQRFSSSDDYCSHLKFAAQGAKLPDNVSRLHYGLTAVGSAIVPNPAASDVGFHDSRFFLAADINNEETSMTDELTQGTGDKVETVDVGTGADTSGTADAGNGALEALVAAAADKLDLFRARVIGMIDAGVAASDMKVLVADDSVLEMSSSAFVLMCDRLRPRTAAPAPGPSLLADEANMPAAVNWNNIFGG